MNIGQIPSSFWDKVYPCPVTGCWHWSGYVYPTGYGYYKDTGYSHRFAFKSFKSILIKGLTIDHLCRNKGCCNPEHLEQVSQKENLKRSPLTMASIRSAKTHCPAGHPYSGDNLLLEKKHGGRYVARVCKICSYSKKNSGRRLQAASKTRP